jgi:hypothetical protein
MVSQLVAQSVSWLSAGQLVFQSVGWLFSCLASQLVGCSVRQLVVGRSTCSSVSRLVVQLFGQSTGWLLSPSFGCRPVNLFFSQLADCSVVWRVNWLVAQLVNQLDCSSVSRLPSLAGGLLVCSSLWVSWWLAVQLVHLFFHS